MKKITQRNFKLLCDFMKVREFMVEIYEKDWRNGVPAPFLEYALSSSWMSLSYTHKFRIWEEEGKIVAFVFHENPISDIYFSLRPGYEELAEEMVTYAVRDMPKLNDTHRLMLFEGQAALQAAAAKAGYTKTGSWNEMVFDFQEPLNFALPEGFHFVKQEELDAGRIAECCWKGFDHEQNEGPWDGDSEDILRIMCAPHATPCYDVAIENEKGEYVCCAGMWWTPENHLAYMEPLCTVPQYRHKGLAAAALSELYHRMKPLGATHMTGGDNHFYAKIGFSPCIGWTFWEKMS